MGGGVGCTVAAVQAEVGSGESRIGAVLWDCLWWLILVSGFSSKSRYWNIKLLYIFFAKIKSKLHSPYNNLAGWRKLVQ